MNLGDAHMSQFAQHDVYKLPPIVHIPVRNIPVHNLDREFHAGTGRRDIRPSQGGLHIRHQAAWPDNRRVA